MKISEEDNEEAVVSDTNLDNNTETFGQLKISIKTNAEPQFKIWKPFNQQEEFDRKAKQSVLYNMKTPGIDKFLRSGKRTGHHHSQKKDDDGLSIGTKNSAETTDT